MRIKNETECFEKSTVLTFKFEIKKKTSSALTYIVDQKKMATFSGFLWNQIDMSYSDLRLTELQNIQFRISIEP